ncbi:unnamed protein product [Bursaphelenchus okinawaensis]|uniref:JmjC domain-containing protein n=1 Tax=Bursaphelenchus okinawaensis TaxID=465554 RepID=A0A811KCX3_9BILA|nr:unnamed protein product [Bursaphelenchus okinawaensis]CAG9101197.1 unnamed protein product [Bursaphelenchus okinawaensis]
MPKIFIILVYLQLLLLPISSTELGKEVIKNGGWTLLDEEPIEYSGECTVERRDGKTLTQDGFLQEYAYTKPLVIYNVENTEFTLKTSRLEMMKHFEHTPVTLNSANTHSYTRVPTTFGDYLDTHLKPQSLQTLGNETLYLFGDIDPVLWKPLLSVYQQPKWTVPEMEPALSFGIAAVGTGVPFHFHGPGFAEVVHGSKLWFLTEPDKKPVFDPDRSTLDWYLNDYPKLEPNQKPFVCLMKPGELIYFPDKWYHATLNMETSVFISTFLSGTAPSRPRNEL